MEMDGIWCAVQTCWSEKAHVHFVLWDYFKGSNPTSVLLVKKATLNRQTKKVGFCLGIYELISLRLGMEIDSHRLLFGYL